ncbi:hypothetical protein SNEBB_007371 [Seison nebaliae]|nr:hypothetical protein SNEBB_007371 [Seison nebaliae]
METVGVIESHETIKNEIVFNVRRAEIEEMKTKADFETVRIGRSPSVVMDNYSIGENGERITKEYTVTEILGKTRPEKYFGNSKRLRSRSTAPSRHRMHNDQNDKIEENRSIMKKSNEAPVRSHYQDYVSSSTSVRLENGMMGLYSAHYYLGTFEGNVSLPIVDCAEVYYRLIVYELIVHRCELDDLPELRTFCSTPDESVYGMKLCLNRGEYHGNVRLPCNFMVPRTVFDINDLNMWNERSSQFDLRYVIVHRNLQCGTRFLVKQRQPLMHRHSVDNIMKVYEANPRDVMMYKGIITKMNAQTDTRFKIELDDKVWVWYILSKLPIISYTMKDDDNNMDVTRSWSKCQLLPICFEHIPKTRLKMIHINLKEGDEVEVEFYRGHERNNLRKFHAINQWRSNCQYEFSYQNTVHYMVDYSERLTVTAAQLNKQVLSLQSIKFHRRRFSFVKEFFSYHPTLVERLRRQDITPSSYLTENMIFFVYIRSCMINRTQRATVPIWDYFAYVPCARMSNREQFSYEEIGEIVPLVNAMLISEQRIDRKYFDAEGMISFHSTLTNANVGDLVLISLERNNMVYGDLLEIEEEKVPMETILLKKYNVRLSVKQRDKPFSIVCIEKERHDVIHKIYCRVNELPLTDGCYDIEVSCMIVEIDTISDEVPTYLTDKEKTIFRMEQEARTSDRIYFSLSLKAIEWKDIDEQLMMNGN